MSLPSAAACFLLAVTLLLAGATRLGDWRIGRRNPPAGSFVEIGGTRIHHVHVPAPAGADLPPLVFIHGASANLNDQLVPLRPVLDGRAEMLFFDRPGHGWSGRGVANETPEAQARLLAALMDRLGVERAIVVGHSFGGAIAAAFALQYPERVCGTAVCFGRDPSLARRADLLVLHGNRPAGDRVAVFRNARLSGGLAAHGRGHEMRVRAKCDSRELSRPRRDRACVASRRVPGECHRRAGALSLRARQRAALPRNHRPDRRDHPATAIPSSTRRSIRSGWRATFRAPNSSG